jgi:hypothetical protein
MKISPFFDARLRILKVIKKRYQYFSLSIILIAFLPPSINRECEKNARDNRHSLYRYALPGNILSLAHLLTETF